MKLKVVFIVVLTLCVLSSFLIPASKRIEANISTHKRFRNLLKVNCNSGKYGSINGLIVQKGGCVVFEKLLGGLAPQPVESITKSVVSLVIGIALKRGDLKGLEQKVLDFFPEYKSRAKKGWDQVTIKDLLTMRSGIVWNEDKRPECANPTFQMYEAADLYEFILRKSLDTVKCFNYSSANAALLSQVIFKATGKSFARYADEFIFKPLKIDRYKWSHYKNGSSNTSGGLCLTVSDLATLGRLYLQEGCWKGKNIIDPEWIVDSFKSAGEVNGYLDVNAYGYLWWLNEHYKIPGTGKYVKVCSACGFNNNHLLLIPELDLLIAVTGNSTVSAEKYLNLLDDVLRCFSE